MTAAETAKEAARLAAYRANPVNRRAEWGAVIGMIGGTVLACWLAPDGRGAVAGILASIFAAMAVYVAATGP